MRILLVCHGDGHAPSLDAPLSERGRERAVALAREISSGHARRQPVGAVYSSPHASALATAALIGSEIGLPEPLRLEGLGAGNEEATLASLRSLQATGWLAIERFREDHGAEDQVIAVTHAVTIQALICRALSMPVEDHHRFRIDPGSLSIIEFRQQQQLRTLVAGLNQTCHLAGIPTD